MLPVENKPRIEQQTTGNWKSWRRWQQPDIVLAKIVLIVACSPAIMAFPSLVCRSFATRPVKLQWIFFSFHKSVCRPLQWPSTSGCQLKCQLSNILDLRKPVYKCLNFYLIFKIIVFPFYVFLT